MEKQQKNTMQKYWWQQRIAICKLNLDMVTVDWLITGSTYGCPAMCRRYIYDYAVTERFSGDRDVDVYLCWQDVTEVSDRSSKASRVTSLEARMSQILTMLARMSATVARNDKLRRRLARLERQLGIVIQQRKCLTQQQQQQQLKDKGYDS